MFVKPANMGSSVGVTKAHDLDELRAALDRGLAYDEWVVVEEGVAGREIEVRRARQRTRPGPRSPGEIVPGAEFYDYDDKYLDGRRRAADPGAAADRRRRRSCRRWPCAAFRALRCEGMARVDFFYEEAGRGLLLNEINTIPGFTPISMYPKLWAGHRASPTGELIDELVGLAIERHERGRARR